MELRRGKHTRQPILPARKIAIRPRLPVLENLHRTPAGHDDAQTSWATNCFLTCSKHDIEIPLVELDFLGADTADAVDNHKSLWADPSDELGELCDFAEYTGRCVDVGDGD